MANKDFKVKNGLDIQTPLPVSMGGTGQTSTTNTLNSLLPTQDGNQNKVLSTDGTNTTWTAQAVAYERGGTASRPASPTAGDLFYNTDNNYFESYTANGWFPIAAAPGIPTSVVATNQPSGRAYNNGKMSVAFSTATNAGAPSSFIVTPTPTTSPTTFTGSSSPIEVTGLASSTQYTYTVSATSPYGTSSASSASSGVTATTVPQSPTINAVTGGAASAAIAFTAGATGGSSITGYTVTSSPGNITGTGSSSPITVTGLTDGTSYTFTMTATNTNGTSLASSASSSIIPNSWNPEGAYDSIASITVPSGGLASVTFAGIPSGYKHLQVRVMSRSSNSLQYGQLFFTLNDYTGGYFRQLILNDGINGPGYYGYTSQTNASMGYFAGNTALTNVFGVGVLDIPDYANPNKNKSYRALAGANNNSQASPDTYNGMVSGVYPSTSPITSIKFFPETGDFMQHTSIALYGVK